MHIKRLDKTSMSEGYTVISQGIHPWSGVAETPFFSCWCVVEPGKTARAHKHQEHESFLIVQGQGRMRVNGEAIEVGPGDAILMEPFDEHELTNLDESEDLIFIDLCWEDMRQAVAVVGGTETAEVEAGRKVIIPVAPASEDPMDPVTFGAQVHARYLAMRGVTAGLLEAPEAGESTVALLESLREGDLLIEKEELAGDGRSHKRLYFPLSRFDAPLADALRGTAMDTYLRAHCDQLLAEGLPDVAVSAAPGEEGLVLEGWEAPVDSRFGRALGFVSAFGNLEENTEVTPFFAAAESFLHAILVPGILLALGKEGHLPKVLRAISRLEVGEGALDGLPAGASAICLAHAFPEVGDSQLGRELAEDLCGRELRGSWESWLKEFDAKVAEAFGGSLPGTGAWTEEQQRFFGSLTRLCSEAAEAYEAATFSPQRVSRILAELVDRARRFGLHEKPWSRVSGRYEEWRTAVAIEALAVKTLALLAAPLSPELATEIWNRLGLDGAPEAWEELPGFVYQTLQGMGEPLFSAA